MRQTDLSALPTEPRGISKSQPSRRESTGGDIRVDSTCVERRTGWLPLGLSEAYEEWPVGPLPADDA